LFLQKEHLLSLRFAYGEPFWRNGVERTEGYTLTDRRTFGYGVCIWIIFLNSNNELFSVTKAQCVPCKKIIYLHLGYCLLVRVILRPSRWKEDQCSRKLTVKVGRWISTSAARVVVDKVALRQVFFPSTSVSPVNLHSTNFSTITINYHPGLVQ
jgi:hypothetical protein